LENITHKWDYPRGENALHGARGDDAERALG
jgi:hypothetical protein